MTNAELLERLANPEDNFVERKESAQRQEIKRAAVAFSNSLQVGRKAVLFIGVRDNGQVVGVQNPDNAQQTIRQALDECYPEINFESQVVERDGLPVLAVVFGHSTRRPHFAGQAYIRAGSSSERASQQQYEAIISEHFMPVRKVREYLNQIVRVRWINKRPGEFIYTAGYVGGADCRVIACDQFTVRIEDISTNMHYEEQIGVLELARDPGTGRLILIFRQPH